MCTDTHLSLSSDDEIGAGTHSLVTLYMVYGVGADTQLKQIACSSRLNLCIYAIYILELTLGY